MSAFASAASGETAPAFEDLLAQAATNAPRLVEGQAGLDIAKGQARQGAAWSNPVLGYEIENFGNVASGPLSEQQTTWTLTQPIELGGERWARAAAGRADVRAAEALRIQSRADFGFDLAMAYAVAETSQRRVALLEDDLQRANENARAARAFVTAGMEADLSAVQAEAAAAGADADLQSARADLADALARLSVLAGSAETYTSIGPSLLAKAESAQDPTDLPPESAPTFVIAQARREAAVRRTQAERGRAVPNVDVTFGARTLERQPETALVGGVSVQLPLFNRNQGGVAVAKAELMAADARARSARIEVTSNWAAARAQLTANRARLSSSTQAEAAARDGYQLMQIAYQAGKASLLELLLARRALNDSATRTLEAQIAALRAQATLARLAGRMPFGE